MNNLLIVGAFGWNFIIKRNCLQKFKWCFCCEKISDVTHNFLSFYMVSFFKLYKTAKELLSKKFKKNISLYNEFFLLLWYDAIPVKIPAKNGKLIV